MERCKKCILPVNYPFLEFVDGICHYCRNYKKKIINDEKFLEILSKNKFKSKNKNYDCLVGLSGGRDSTYGLYILKEKYKLKPLAYTYDWGFVSEAARMNISKICGLLNVERIVRSDSIKKIRYLTSLNVKALLKDLKLGMLPIVQSLDKKFLHLTKVVAKQNDIDLVIHFTGYECEQRDFFLGFTNVNQKISTNQHMFTYNIFNKLKLAIYYSYNFLKNPNYINEAFFENIKAFYYSFIEKNNMVHFYNYHEWNEEKIENVLESIGYIRNEDYSSNQWRMGDTQTAFNNYIYYNLCGFTEYDEFRSHQIRLGHLTREKAIELVKIDNKPKHKAIEKFCSLIDLNTNEFYKIVENSKKNLVSF